jgi:hypothetical protein
LPVSILVQASEIRVPPNAKKGDRNAAAFSEIGGLERLDVLGLPAFRSFDDVKLHCLALLQALETASLNR